MIKGSVQQEDTTVVSTHIYIYVPNIRTKKYIKQLTNIRGNEQ